MAIITYSGLVTDVRGKFGSTVFKGGRNGGGIVQEASTCVIGEFGWTRPWGILAFARSLWYGLPMDQQTVWALIFGSIDDAMRAFIRIVTYRWEFLHRWDLTPPSSELPSPEDPWWWPYHP